MLKPAAKQYRFFNLLIISLPILVLIISLSFGRLNISLPNIIGILAGQIFDINPFWSSQEATIILQIRLPRLLMALLIGSGLGVSGAAFQGIFKNPLVSPHILGVASGAGFGGALGLLLFHNDMAVPVLAFLFGLIAVYLTTLIGYRKNQTNTLSLVLAGIISATFFSALISLVKFVADPIDQLPSIVFWLMGSLASASYQQLAIVAIPLALSTVILLMLRWQTNLASLPDDEAKSLGVNIQKTRWLIIFLSTVIVALAVSVSGIIGWIGLVIPHIARIFVGADHKLLLPLSASLGAAYLMIVDDMARSLTAAEIPLGIITALVGAVVFGYLFRKSYDKSWQYG